MERIYVTVNSYATWAETVQVTATADKSDKAG